jgi:hypothetical protein
VDVGPSRVSLENVVGRVGDPNSRDMVADAIELDFSARELDTKHPRLGSIDAHLVVDNAVLPDARVLQAFIPAREGLRVASGTARASGDVTLSSSTHTGTGVIEVDIDRGALGLHETELAGDFAIRARVRGFAPESGSIDLTGSTLTMTNVRVDHAAAETDHWRGEIMLQTAKLRLEDGPDAKDAVPRLDGIVRLDADDARPLLGVLLRDSVPGFVTSLVAMPRLRGVARLRVSPRVVLLSDVTAAGGDVALRGSYGLYDNERRGAFIVEKGPFSVGLDLDKHGVRPRFFNLAAWLGAKEHATKAKAQELSGTSPSQGNDRRDAPR